MLEMTTKEKQGSTITLSHDTAKWYAVRTKPSQEELAQLHLERQQFKTYLPQTIKTIKHARKTTQAKRPLFPGYLFVCLTDSEKRWTTIGSTRGTIGPVRFNTHYPSVPTQVIEQIKAKENSNGCIETTNSLAKGQKIIINEGEWEGLTGVFQGMRGTDRSIILLNMLQRQVKTDIESSIVEAV